MFEGFELEWIDVGGVTLRVRHGGSGPGLLLLHGHPRTHATWHRVAPLLARHTVVCPDLRGYGDSSKPPTTSDHEPYSKRAMARDCIALMRRSATSAFAVVGHDRGALRGSGRHSTIPTPSTPSLCSMRVPIGEALDALRRPVRGALVALVLPRADGQAGRAGDLRRPRRLVPADAGAHGRGGLRRLPPAIHDPETVHAMCEDYGAGARNRPPARRGDRAAGRRSAARCLSHGAPPTTSRNCGATRQVIWRNWANDVRGARIDSGHHMAEEAPRGARPRVTGLRR